MAKEIVLVNGVPGSGKTTLGRRLADHLCVPFLSKDRIKEALADAIAHPAAGPRLGTVAMETVWALAAALPGRVVIDSWWFRPRDLQHACNGLATAGAGVTVEVWCDVPIPLAQERYARRLRHGVHRDDRDMTSEWDAWAADAAPLAIGPVIAVDTDAPVDVVSLAAGISAALSAPGIGAV